MRRLPAVGLTAFLAVLFPVCVPASSASDAEGALAAKIARDHKIVGQDEWYGFRRTKFSFNGYVAWVVEPSVKPLKGNPWTWTMQWAEAFVKRTGVPDALAEGYHHATIELFATRMCDKGVATAAEFQKYLVGRLAFAPKANLIGMSWGGFFSVRYAAAHPENVRRVYLDAPLLTFSNFAPSAAPTEAARRIGPWAAAAPADGNWGSDPRMPVNLAGKIAAAKIPVLLLYGGQDKTVDPQVNSVKFIENFKKAGGDIEVDMRWAYGHHPHGVELDETGRLLKFFK